MNLSNMKLYNHQGSVLQDLYVQNNFGDQMETLHVLKLGCVTSKEFGQIFRTTILKTL